MGFEAWLDGQAIFMGCTSGSRRYEERGERREERGEGREGREGRDGLGGLGGLGGSICSLDSVGGANVGGGAEIEHRYSAVQDNTTQHSTAQHSTPHYN